MALTQAESATLMNDQAFKGRVKVCCLRYADAIMIEATSVAAHNTRLAWAKRVMQMPDQVAFETTPPVVMDAAVQAAGSEIGDPELQGSVEATINKAF